MSDDRMKAEYPDEKQRVAVAMSMLGMKKRIAMTSQSSGHAHSLITNCEGGEIHRGQTSYVDGHTHDWIMDDAGNILLGDANGHTHVIAALVMKGEEVLPQEFADLLRKLDETATDDAARAGGDYGGTGMTPEEKAALEKAAQEKLDAVTKRAERAEKLAELNDAQKQHMAKLGKDDQERFLSLKPEERADEVAKAAESNPVIYTSESDGSVFRKNDDPRLVALAKRADTERKERLSAESRLKSEELRKRASELEHLPGTEEERIALLKAVDALPEKEREAATKLLKAHDAGLAKAFERQGTRGAPTADSPDAKLEEIAKRIREKDPKLTEAQAMVKALETPEGRAAYEQRVPVTN